MIPTWEVIQAGPTYYTLVARSGRTLLSSTPLDMMRHQTWFQALEVAAMRASERIGCTFTPGSWASDYARGYWAGISETMADRAAKRAA